MNQSLIDSFCDHLSIQRQRASTTISSYTRDIQQFFLLTQIQHPSQVTNTHVHHYLNALNKKNLSHKSIHRKLSALDQYWAFLWHHQHVSVNPWEGIRRPRIPAALPTYLEEHAMLELLDNYPKKSFLDHRNHAILELLFATGMRVNELIHLSISAFDWEKNTCRITGKGEKERLALFGIRARQALDHYISTVRNTWCRGNSRAAFISPNGHALTARTIQRMVKASNAYHSSSVAITPHTCRHTCASLLLVHGASIRDIQELLGHASISTTQRYSHLPAHHLKTRFLAAMDDAR